MTVLAGGPARLGVRPTGAWRLMALVFTLASPALAGSVRCTTDEERPLGRWQTLALQEQRSSCPA